MFLNAFSFVRIPSVQIKICSLKIIVVLWDTSVIVDIYQNSSLSAVLLQTFSNSLFYTDTV